MEIGSCEYDLQTDIMDPFRKTRPKGSCEKNFGPNGCNLPIRKGNKNGQDEFVFPKGISALTTGPLGYLFRGTFAINAKILDGEGKEMICVDVTIRTCFHTGLC